MKKIFWKENEIEQLARKALPEARAKGMFPMAVGVKVFGLRDLILTVQHEVLPADRCKNSIYQRDVDQLKIALTKYWRGALSAEARTKKSGQASTPTTATVDVKSKTEKPRREKKVTKNLSAFPVKTMVNDHLAQVKQVLTPAGTKEYLRELIAALRKLKS